LNIIFDLDGTVINSKIRLYKLFQELTEENVSLAYEEYWEYKKNKISHEEILKNNFGYSNSQIIKFTDKWMKLIESPRFLKYDTFFPGIHKKLKLLGKSSDLYLCTARQSRENTIMQLKELKLLSFFRGVLITEHATSKEKLIRLNIDNISNSDWFVGDTGDDINTGKSLNINTCAVTSGFLKEEILIKYGPDILISMATDFNPIKQQVEHNEGK